jgi:hypothetical protein
MFESMENQNEIESNKKKCPNCKKLLADMVCININCDFFRHKFEEVELENMEEEKREEEEFVGGGGKENPELPKSEFEEYYKKTKKEKGEEKKDIEEGKEKIEKNEGVEKVSSRIVFGKGPEISILFASKKREDEEEIEKVTKEVEDIINLAIKKGEITENDRKSVWDALEEKDRNIFYFLKKKRYIPMKEQKKRG